MNGKQLKNSILQWAIQGKLVPQDPNDEPASVLLEKIRAEKTRLVKEGKLKKKDLEVKPVAEDEIPFEVPNNWVWVRLGDIFELKSGQDFPPEKYNSNQKGIPYITGASNLDGDTIIMNRWTETPSVIAPKGCLLLVCKGSGVGKLCYMSIDEAHIARQIQAIIPLSENVDITYIRIVLESRINEIIQQANGVIPGIAREVALSFTIPLPPLAEQHRIVAKIEELTPLVEKYGAAQEALEEWNNSLPEKLKKSILQEAIQGKLVPQDPNDEPASVLIERIREEKKRLVKEGKLKKKDLEVKPIEEVPFELPKSWQFIKLVEICQLNDGEKRNEPHICIDAKFLRGKSSGEIVGSGRFVQKDDHVILVDGENSGEVFATPCDGYMGSTFKQLWISGEMHLPYVLYFIRFYKNLLRNSKKGAAIPHLNKEIFYSLPIGIPPFAEQRRIVAKIEELFGVIKK